MKKLFTFLVLAILCLSFSLSACSCSDATILAFNNNFNGGNQPSAGYKETVTYSVNYQQSNEYVSAKTISSDMKIEFSEGTYVQTLEVLEGGSALPEGVSSDILESKVQNKSIYYLKTRLDIGLTTTLPNAEPVNSAEFIETETWFCDSSLSFAPIYSKTTSKTTALYLVEAGSIIRTVEWNYGTTYNLNSYTVKGASKYYDAENEVTTPIDRTTEYQFRSLIDNSQLLFALRNFALASEESNYVYINTLSVNYSEPKILAVKTEKAPSKNNLALDYNNALIESLDVARYSFAVSEQNASGMSQYFGLYTPTSESEVKKCLVTSYVEPIIEYAGMACIGSLVYEIASVKIG